MKKTSTYYKGLHSLPQPPMLKAMRGTHKTPGIKVTMTDIMAAILMTPGPVTTHDLLLRYGPSCLRSPWTKKTQFVEAAMALQSYKLGSLVEIPNGSRFSSIFVKARPSEAGMGLSANPELGTLEKYTKRCNMAIPPCISLKVRTQLVKHGYMSEKQATKNK